MVFYELEEIVKDDESVVTYVKGENRVKSDKGVDLNIRTSCICILTLRDNLLSEQILV